MRISKKASIKRQKQVAEKNLAIRLELLKSKGWDDKQILKDAKIKQFKAQRREQNQRLTTIAALESLALRKAETKAKKIEAMKSAPPKIKTKHNAPGAPKKTKKEKKARETAEE